MFPWKLVDFQEGPECDVIRMGNPRLECFATTRRGKPEDLVGKYVSARAEFDGRIHLTAVPKPILKHIDDLTGWGF